MEFINVLYILACWIGAGIDITAAIFILCIVVNERMQR